jgi:serine/threonine protein kinase
MIVVGAEARRGVPQIAAEVGTPFYMAPEVAVKHRPPAPLEPDYTFPHRSPVGLAADIWPIGVMAYEALANKRWMEPEPNTGRSPEALAGFQTLLLEERVCPRPGDMCMRVSSLRPH